jgi:excisionase family DNA binding protein
MKHDFELLRLLTLAETAEFLQVSTRTLHRMITRKGFPAFKVRGQWRVHESHVAKWMESLHDR